MVSFEDKGLGPPGSVEGPVGRRSSGAATYAELEQECAELTKALTGLTCGGSEFFNRKGDRYVADIPACVAWVRRSKEDAHNRTVSALYEAIRLREALTTIAEGVAPPEQHGHFLAHRAAVKVAREALSQRPTANRDELARERSASK